VAADISGVLVEGHDAADYGRVLADLLGDHRRRDSWPRAPACTPRPFGWDATAAAVLDVYAAARIDAGRSTSRRRLAPVARVG
jgi:D-inositol-3-phosphate glycosyltransferase